MMKNFELFSLAKDFICDSKVYKKIIRSYTFAFVLLIISIWLCLALFDAVITQINVGTNGRTIYIEYTDEGYINSQKTGFSAFLMNEEECVELKGKFAHETVLKGTGLTFGGEFNAIIDSISKAIANNLIFFIESGNLELVAGSGFTSNKREVLVSQDFVVNSGYPAGELIRRTLSCVAEYDGYTDYMSSQVLDDDNDPNNVTLNEGGEYIEYRDDGGAIGIMSDFVIVGVYDNDSKKLVNGADIVCHYSSLVDGENSYLPSVNNRIIMDRYGKFSTKSVLTYQTTNYIALAQDASTQGMIFPFILGGDFYSRWNADLNGRLQIVHAERLLLKDYFAVKGASNYVENLLERGGLSDFTSLTVKVSMLSQDFIKTYQFDDVFTFILILTSVFGMSAFFATMLNYYNVQSYNVRYKTKNMAMNMALGMTHGDIRKLFLFEFCHVFIKALKYSAIIAVALIGILTFVLVTALPNIISMTFIGWSLLYYITAILSTIAINLLLGSILTVATTRKFFYGNIGKAL